MISTHTHHTKTQKKKYTHEVKVNKKKQDAVSSWSKLAKKKETKQEVVKMIRSSISRPHQVNSPRIPFPRPAPPSVPAANYLHARTPHLRKRVRKRMKEEKVTRAQRHHTHTHTQTCKHFKVNTYLACANSYCHSGREICDFFHTHTHKQAN